MQVTEDTFSPSGRQRDAIVSVGRWPDATTDSVLFWCSPEEYQQLMDRRFIEFRDSKMIKLKLTEFGRVWYTYLLEWGWA